MKVENSLDVWSGGRSTTTRSAERPVPGYVEAELRGSLECGLLCFGFGRVLCTGCGQGFVIAFSRQGRGVCPSCNGRHMAQTAVASTSTTAATGGVRPALKAPCPGEYHSVAESLPPDAPADSAATGGRRPAACR